ncbi:MAG: DNA/RNA nuclease SfsA [Methanosarcinaceae archaeon]|nr:DNA/RNA nuclease SfsA [Methanosarcinaceae archaeon]
MQHSKKKFVLDIPWDAEAIFVSRDNRFLGTVDVVGPMNLKGEKVHIHDPGRLKEILYAGNSVLLRRSENGKRKTKWDLVAGKVGDIWVLVNSAYHRKIAEWVLRKGLLSPLKNIDTIKPEQNFGSSRLDFLLGKGEERIWVEVKGCTLVKDNVALFPDAPTLRGKRHVEELIKAVEYGDSSMALILVFRNDVECFKPNREIDPAFAETFGKAVEKGVLICPMVFSYEDEKLYYNSQIPLCEH